MKRITHLLQPQILLIAFLITYTTQSQVGIGTVDPTTTLDINGSLSIRDGGTITLSNGNNNNVVLPTIAGEVYSNYRIVGPTGYFNIGSIVPVSAVDGQMVTLQNTTDELMHIRHNAGGTGVNRILVPAEQDLFLTGRYSSVTLMYSDAQNRWIVQNKLSDETIWYTPPQNFAPNTVYNLTYNVPPATSVSAVSVNLLGDWSIATQPTNDITIHHIEARTGQVRFIVENSSATTTYIGMDFVISVRN